MGVDYTSLIADIDREIASFIKKSRNLNDEYAEALKDVAALSQIKHQFYKTRYDYVLMKFDVQRRIIEMTELRKKKVRDILVSYKKQEVIDPEFTDFQFNIKNNDERDIMESNFLAKLDSALKLLDEYNKMLIEAVSTIDKMCFAIPYVIEMEKYKNHFN